MSSKSYLSTATARAALASLLLSAACESDKSQNRAEDNNSPSVASHSPVDDAVGVPRNALVSVAFSKAMDPSTLTASTLTLTQATAAVAGAVSYSDGIANFTPANDLLANSVYTATVTTAAKSLDDHALAENYVWTFTTGSVVDAVAPTVVSVNPTNLSPAVVVNRSITVSFSEAMNATTVDVSSFTVSGPGNTSVAGTVSHLGPHATFNPNANLARDTVFTANITTSVQDMAGNALASNYVWSFTTGANLSMGPDPVLLGRAGDFVILAKSGVDTVPDSAVVGNVGVSPIDSTAVTGFSLTMHASNEYSTSDQVTGQVYAADYASPTSSNLTTAISNMETAFTDAAGRPTPDETNLGAGEIGGLTLVPGLYKWGTGLSIATDVTLHGGPNDVWIFQISEDITQANGTHVTLSGGALPKNIFWQAFGQVMIRTTAHFEGVVLCMTAIILETGASVNGRLLAQTSVVLDQNTVTQPSL